MVAAASWPRYAGLWAHAGVCAAGQAGVPNLDLNVMTEDCIHTVQVNGLVYGSAVRDSEYGVQKFSKGNIILIAAAACQPCHAGIRPYA